MDIKDLTINDLENIFDNAEPNIPFMILITNDHKLIISENTISINQNWQKTIIFGFGPFLIKEDNEIIDHTERQRNLNTLLNHIINLQI